MAEKSSPEIRDFDALAPKARKARIGGRVVEIGPIPARITLEMARLADEAESGGGQEDQIKKIVSIVARVVQQTDETVTEEWLFDNTTMNGLLAFVNFVLQPAVDKAAEAEQGNPEAASSDESS